MDLGDAAESRRSSVDGEGTMVVVYIEEEIIFLVLKKVPLSFLAFFFVELSYLALKRVLFGFLALLLV
jgi:hypothetical protein